MVIPRQWVSLKSGMLSELVNRIYLEKENGKHNLAASPVSKALLLLKELPGQLRRVLLVFSIQKHL